MAEERTEAATPRRLQELHARGQAARSADLTGALVLLAAVWSIQQAGPSIVDGLEASVHRSLLELAGPRQQPTDEAAWLGAMVSDVLGMLAPVVLPVLVVSVLVGLLQSGRAVSFRLVLPETGRLNPWTNVQRLFGGAGLVELGRALLKLLLVLAAVQGPVRASFASLPIALSSGLGAATRSLVGSVIDVAGAGAEALVALAVADFLYRRWQFARQARMTRQEVREEVRQLEGDPLVRSRIRALQRRLARRRMLHRVREAQVVVTNPTHVAVALAYTPGRHAAPEVVAKGADLLAERIKTIAREHRVPIVPNPPLAQALYKSVEIGQQIPHALYQAVAEVLAYVYSLRRRV